MVKLLPECFACHTGCHTGECQEKGSDTEEVYGSDECRNQRQADIFHDPFRGFRGPDMRIQICFFHHFSPPFPNHGTHIISRFYGILAEIALCRTYIGAAAAADAFRCIQLFAPFCISVPDCEIDLPGRQVLPGRP